MKIKIIILFLLITSLTKAQMIDSVYNYPVRPGTEAWHNHHFKTNAERENAVQIPTDLLKKMSTKSLVISCLNYPLFFDITAFDNVQYGMRKIISSFNGLTELMNRKDAPTVLLDIYYQMDSLTMGLFDERINKEGWSIRRRCFEYLLAQDEIINNMDDSTKTKVLIEARSKMYHKIDNQKGFSVCDYQASFLIMGKILDKLPYQEFQQKKNEDKDLGDFLEKGGMIQPSSLKNIIETTDTYIKKQKK